MKWNWGAYRDRVAAARISPLLLTNEMTGNDTTPLALLEDEAIAFAVHADSSIKTGIKTGKDFIVRLQHDPSSVSIGGLGIGGPP
jgi:tripartite-type tricarboxylate transporter receptor subunit TctC